jgi:thymidylate synthase (FAD)
VYMDAMEYLQDTYDSLRAAGIPAEDARMVLPNGATCNMVLTCNLRTFLEFYEKRKEGSGAQWEIAELAEKMRSEIVNVEPWIENLFV